MDKGICIADGTAQKQKEPGSLDILLKYSHLPWMTHLPLKVSEPVNCGIYLFEQPSLIST